MQAKHRGYCHLGRHHFTEGTMITRRNDQWVCEDCAREHVGNSPLTSRSVGVAGRRHDLDPVLCRDCGDTGFVILARDVGPDALAGDAAPCHCEAGQAKMHRLGTVHYARDDYEPLVPDPAVADIWFQEYAQTEAGKADPNRAAYEQFIQKPKEMP